MKEQLKASVLARIGGMSYEEELENGWEYERRHYDGRSWHRLHKGCITYDFDHWDADDDPVWDLAADILGIKPKEERPSDTLLKRAWNGGEAYAEFGKFGPKEHAFTFDDFIATLPPNPLKADRELVASAFENEDWEKELINGAYNQEFINTLKRLAGMEVPNE